MSIEAGKFRSALQIQNEYLSKNISGKQVTKKENVSFQDIFHDKISVKEAECEKLKFSKHANSRLLDRNISLTENQMERLQKGAKKASSKGIAESLVLIDDLAFIVNVKNSTVVTAMDQTETNENVFTNIDGAVIM